MIDFRYHLVSLISVFLALAVGVVLGAGPLQNSLGTALNDQVTSLRQDRNDLQTLLESTEAAVNDRDAYLTAAADSYLPGTLEGRRVALVLLPGAAGEDVDDVTTRLTTSGATVTDRVTLTDVWTDSSRESFRSTYSGQFAGYLDQPAAAGGNTVLGQGLTTALTAAGDKAKALTDLLTATDTPLMTIDSASEAKAEMVVVIGPRSTDPRSGAAPTPTASPVADPAGWVSTLTGAATGATVVVVGGADQSGDLVTALRKANAPVTTIDSVGQASAAVSVPLALADTATGTKSAYGFDDGAAAVMPPLAK